MRSKTKSAITVDVSHSYGCSTMTRKKRNPNQFTTDEAQTATLIVTEGEFPCFKAIRRPPKVKYERIYRYPAIRISMCVKEALEPASRIFKTKIVSTRTKKIECPPELFPPDGRGRYVVVTRGKRAKQIMERLKPLITSYHYQKWKEVLEKCR